MVTGPAIARGAAPPMVTYSCTTTGKGVTERIVTRGGSTNLSTCNPPLIVMGMGQPNSLAAVTARTRLDNTTAADQRYAISRSRLVTGLQAMV